MATMITDQKEVVKVLETIQVEAEKRAKRETSRYGTLSTGDWHAQGDVMFTKLEDVPKDAIKEENPSAQLAPGNTRGSRHVIKAADMAKCTFFRLKSPNALQGPVVKTEEPIEVEHPDHGHVILPKGTYQITYQRQFAPQLKRVVD